uniref:Integrase catalytic domain-containing protein n=1 Tax=Strongyloides papillosus TaxID=174720 RepID=A0A0N5CCL1_STREA
MSKGEVSTKYHRPWERLNMDIRGPLPITGRKNEYLLVVADDFSKFTIVILLKKMNTENIIYEINNQVFSRYGTPKVIRLDNAQYFVNNLFNEFMKSWNVEIRTSIAYNHYSNGLVERSNRTINEIIACYKAEENWDIVVPTVIGVYNNQVNTSTGQKPFEILHEKNKEQCHRCSIHDQSFKSTRGAYQSRRNHLKSKRKVI